MLSTVVGEHKESWESHLRSVCMAYNTSVQPTTGYSPLFLMFGRTGRMPIDLVYGTNSPHPYNVIVLLGTQLLFWRMLIDRFVQQGVEARTSEGVV